MLDCLDQIIYLSDGVRSSVEIAKFVGLSPRYVCRLTKKHNLPRRREGGGPGELNHQFVCGRRIDLDGYVLVTVPSDHPYARQRTNRATKLMYEHRWIVEQTLGRYLLPEEVVDHGDGLHLHNAPSNLTVFASNADHLRETLAGRMPRHSVSGQKNIRERFDLPEDRERVDTYRQRKKAGDVRLHQILLAALSLGIDSPYLLGTTHHIKKAQIDVSSHSKIERALADLSEKLAKALSQ